MKRNGEQRTKNKMLINKTRINEIKTEITYIDKLLIEENSA